MLAPSCASVRHRAQSTRLAQQLDSLFGGRVVSEPERRIRTQGPTATEFHLSNNTGFPPGEYKVAAASVSEKLGASG